MRELRLRAANPTMRWWGKGTDYFRGLMQVIAHLSDSHLDTSPERLARFRAVLDLVVELPAVEALLVTGDLTDHGTQEEYQEFFNALPAGIPTVVLPGNHDLSASMKEAMTRHGYDGSLNSVLTVGEITIVGLDSHIDHQDEGLLSEETLQFARQTIRTAAGSVVIALHHPPVLVGHHVMDDFGLRNVEDMRRLVEEHPNVVAVFTGHVHTALATTFAGLPLLGAPGIVSTMRLGSRTDPIADDAAVPGLALHTLDGSTVRTVFHSLSPASW